jgi:sensor histidine kinase YesM
VCEGTFDEITLKWEKIAFQVLKAGLKNAADFRQTSGQCQQLLEELRMLMEEVRQYVESINIAEIEELKTK